MTTLTTPPQFRNLLYKSNAQAKSIDYYVAEARSHTDEHKRIIIYTYGAILRSSLGALTSRFGDLSGKTLDINTDRTWWGDDTYSSYEQAAIAGIEYVLYNLI